MEPDSPAAPRALDVVERAHLREPGDASHVMHRYAAAPEFEGLLQRFWIPVWSVPPGREAPQRVLQYPVALLVVALGYARFYGVAPGLSTTTLTGEGWAVGVMCAPAAGALVAGGPMRRYTGRRRTPSSSRLASSARASGRGQRRHGPGPARPGEPRCGDGRVRRRAAPLPAGRRRGPPGQRGGRG